MTRVAAVTDEELRARRERILAKLGIPLDELRDRATRYALVGDEYEAWEQLESIAFLLGESGA
jgi:predicted neuraminidase